MSFKTPKFIKNNKFWAILFALIPLSFLLAPHAMAGFGDWAGSVVGGLIGVFIWALGKILVITIQALIIIASYQHFVDSQAVMEGWRIVRDLANMFFVVILLIIAFSTILHLENFSYKKWLPKLILMAILINFSKTICGLLIDVAQVVMLTFVNAFKDVAGGNFVELLGIKEIVTLSTDTDNIGFFTIVSAYILGLIYMIVALVVIVTMMAMLAMRLVMIWIYVVLSPLAYLLSAFPGGAQYASQWWKEFISNLIVGPVIAFFIWLSFAALQTGSDLDIVSNSQNANSLAEEESEAMHSSAGEDKPVAGTEASKPSVLIKFVIGIGMLIGGLKIAQQVGGSAGSIAGKGMSKLSKLGAVGAGAVGGMALASARGARNFGLGVAKKAKLKEGLGAIAGSSKGLLKYTGIRSLATSSLIGLNHQQKKVSDKAEAKIADLKDSRVVSRYAREGGGIMASKQETQRKARVLKPEAIKDTDEMTKTLNDMSPEDLQKVPEKSWYQVGLRTRSVPDNVRDYLEGQNLKTSAFNSGLAEAPVLTRLLDTQWVKRVGPGGIPLTDNVYGSFGPRGSNTPSVDKKEYWKAENKHKYDLLKEGPAVEEMDGGEGTTKVEPEENEKPSEVQRGSGALSVNRVAAGEHIAAVDFDKLNINDIEKGKEGDKDWRNTRGVNTSNPEAIKEISGKMVELISSEIAGLQAKGNLSGGEQMRLNKLQESKKVFEDPAQLKNVQLINSSANKYKLSDAKESVVHEQVHGLGFENEDDVRYATDKILTSDNHNYGARKEKKEVDDILSEKPNAQREPQQIVEDEKIASQEVETEENNPDKKEINSDKKEAGFNLEIDSSKLDNSFNEFSKRLDGISKKYSNIKLPVGQMKNTDNTRILYWMRNLRRAILTKNKKGQNVVSKLGGDKVETPLEMEVVVNNMPKNVIAGSGKEDAGEPIDQKAA